MALELHLDWLGWGSYDEDADGNLRILRPALVTGLTGPAHRRADLALGAPGMPKRGSKHPTHKDAKVAGYRVSSQSDDPDSARVEITYQTPDEGVSGEEGGTEVEWITETVTETTIEDKDGNIMRTEYAQFSASGGVTLIQRSHRVEVERVMYSVRLTRRLGHSARRYNIDYANRVNSRSWSGFAAKTVRCRGFTSQQLDENDHSVTGIFAFSPTKDGTWVTDVVTTAETTIPADAALGNGIEEYELYKTADFNASGFEIPED